MILTTKYVVDEESFCTTARLTITQVILAVSTNSYLNEEIFVEQSPRFDLVDSESKALRLRKTLYGLMREINVWHKQLMEQGDVCQSN